MGLRPRRRSPPREALQPREGEDDHGDGHDGRYAAYTTASPWPSRRGGAASRRLWSIMPREGRLGRRPLCLHVNRLNTPALRLYDRLGFSVVPDWYGYNNQRFLLFAVERRGAGDAAPPLRRGTRCRCSRRRFSSTARRNLRGRQTRRPRLRTRGCVRHRVPAEGAAASDVPPHYWATRRGAAAGGRRLTTVSTAPSTSCPPANDPLSPLPRRCVEAVCAVRRPPGTSSGECSDADGRAYRINGPCLLLAEGQPAVRRCQVVGRATIGNSCFRIRDAVDVETRIKKRRDS